MIASSFLVTNREPNASRIIDYLYKNILNQINLL